VNCEEFDDGCDAAAEAVETFHHIINSLDVKRLFSLSLAREGHQIMILSLMYFYTF